MNGIRIDFARPRRGPGIGTGILFSICACFFAWSAWEYLAALRQNADLAQSIADMRGAGMRRKEAPLAPLSEDAVSAINEAIGQINLPWNDLLAAFETGQPKNVALLALEPDARRQLFNVQAEAKTPEAMIDFLRQLEAYRKFSEVVLIRHEVDAQDPGKPIRFVIQARWKGHG